MPIVTVTQVPMAASTATMVSITPTPTCTFTPTPTPTRIVQVNLETHQKPYQYSSDVVNAFGANACGLVAATAPFVSPNSPGYIQAMQNLVDAAGYDDDYVDQDGNHVPAYGPGKGIQPSDFVRGLKGVYGENNVKAYDNWNIDSMFDALTQGFIVIVDIKVQQDLEIPSSVEPNYAHFARVLGIDKVKNGGEIYIENTLGVVNASYWTVDLTNFGEDLWVKPETGVNLRPDPNPQPVSKWAVTIAPGSIPLTPTPTP